MEPIDFDEVEKEFKTLGTNAQTTLLYRLLRNGGPMIWRTVIKYCRQFLDTHNRKLDKDDPLRKKYLKPKQKQ